MSIRSAYVAAFFAALLYPFPASGLPVQVQTAPDRPGQAADSTILPADSTTLHLGALLQEVQLNNPSLRAARLQAEALGARVPQVTALPDPMVGLSYQPYSVLTARGVQRSQWRVEQAVPFPGKRRLRGEVAGLSASVAGAEAETHAHDLAFQVKTTYDELYRIQEQTALVKRFQAELRRFEAAAATRYEVGTGMQQAILKAQLERHALSIRLEKLAAERQAALETMAHLLNRPSTEGFAAARIADPRPSDLPEEGLYALALNRRPEADAVRYDVERADRRIALAKKAFWPDFTVGLNYFDIGRADVIPSMTGRDAFAVNVGVKIPLWRGKPRASLNEARLDRQRADARQEALQTAFRTQINDLTHQRARQERQLILLDEALIPQAETTMEATLSAYTTGRTDFLDLLDSERTLFNLRMERIDTYVRYLKTTAALERALGLTASY